MKRTIQTPKVRIKTKVGSFDLVIQKSDRVELSGSFKLDGANEVPFTLVLKRVRSGKAPCWRTAEITGLEEFTETVVEGFTEWAESKPNLFAMADKIGEHNAAHESSSK